MTRSPLTVMFLTTTPPSPTDCTPRRYSVTEPVGAKLKRVRGLVPDDHLFSHRQAELTTRGAQKLRRGRGRGRGGAGWVIRHTTISGATGRDKCQGENEERNIWLTHGL